MSADTEGYLGPLTTRARETEGPIAEGAALVPLASAEFLIEPGFSPSEDQTTYSDVAVDLLFRYEGTAEGNTFRIRFRYGLTRNGSWSIESSAIDEDSPLPAWATGPVATSKSDNFLAIFRPGLERPEQTLSLAEDALSKIKTRSPAKIVGGQVLLLASNQAQYEDLSSLSSPPSAIAHLETTYEIGSNFVGVEGRQIVVNLEKLSSTKDALETLQHELGHLVLAATSRPFTPGWISEGAAMYLADQQPVSTWKAGVRKGEFAQFSFEELSSALSPGEHDPTGDSVSFEYAFAAAGARYLIETFGADMFWKFYNSFAEIPAGEVYERLTGDGSESAMADLAGETTRSSLTNVFALDEATLDLRVMEWIKAKAA